MTVELLAALIVIALGVVQVILQASEYRRVHGVAYANTAQDTPSSVPDSVLLGGSPVLCAICMRPCPSSRVWSSSLH